MTYLILLIINFVGLVKKMKPLCSLWLLFRLCYCSLETWLWILSMLQKIFGVRNLLDGCADVQGQHMAIISDVTMI